MTNVERAPRERLYWLIESFESGALDVAVFCREFEHTYNLELDKTTLSPIEASAFSDLFEKVIWYSPCPEERTRIPNYLSEEQIRAAVDEASRLLKGR